MEPLQEGTEERIADPAQSQSWAVRTGPALDIPPVSHYMSNHGVVLHRRLDTRPLKQRESAFDGDVIQCAHDSVATLLLRGLGYVRSLMSPRLSAPSDNDIAHG